MSVAAAFDAVAGEYDAARRRLVPCFAAFYGTARELVAEWGPAPGARVLDLGAGTGLLAAMIRASHPDCVLTLVDVAPAMLDEARHRLGEQGGTAFLVADYATACLGGPYDLVVSALSIHHLPDCDKQRLFGRIHTASRQAGCSSTPTRSLHLRPSSSCVPMPAGGPRPLPLDQAKPSLQPPRPAWPTIAAPRSRTSSPGCGPPGSPKSTAPSRPGASRSTAAAGRRCPPRRRTPAPRVPPALRTS
jgi:SAM-dependent methyltransferase